MSVNSLILTKGKLVNVERRTTTQDTGGDPVGTWAGVYAGVRVFIQPASGGEAVRYGRENTRRFVQAFARVGPDIRPDDRLTGGYLGSRILDIQAVRNPGEFQTGALAHIAMECEETDG